MCPFSWQPTTNQEVDTGDQVAVCEARQRMDYYSAFKHWPKAAEAELGDVDASRNRHGQGKGITRQCVRWRGRRRGNLPSLVISSLDTNLATMWENERFEEARYHVIIAPWT